MDYNKILYRKFLNKDNFKCNRNYTTIGDYLYECHLDIYKKLDKKCETDPKGEISTELLCEIIDVLDYDTCLVFITELKKLH